MITRNRDYIDKYGMPSARMLQSVMAEHAREAEKYTVLRQYYDGNTAITRRYRGAGLPNNRLAHPIARYIAAVTSGYLAGNPVSYDTTEENKPTLDAIVDAYRRISISSVDADNARNAAIYGKGVEHVHLAEDQSIHIVSLSPVDAFVVYDDTYDQRPLFGVYAIERHNEVGDLIGASAWIMSDTHIMHVVSPDMTLTSVQEVETVEHYFGAVPLVEYWNDGDEHGDYESITSLIDAYDTLQSDRVNDKEQFVDALLVLTGCTLDRDVQGRTPAEQLRQDKMLSLPDIDAKAQYLVNSLHEADIDILRNAISDDIHKLSMVPDLSDKNFAANASGVAMRFKLWGLEQLTNIKEQWFIEGLRTRLKLMAHYMAVLGMPEMNVPDVTITMTRSLPANELEKAQITQTMKAAGAASVETMVRTLHDDWADDAIETEVEKILCESDSVFAKNSELQAAGAISLAELRASITGEEAEEAERKVSAIDEKPDALGDILNTVPIDAAQGDEE